MLRCIIIDDEPLALDLLEDNIRKVPFLELTGRCRSALEALPLLQQGNIDLVFSDIEMPGLNGLQLIQSLPTRPMFIMITAYEQFAMEGYNLDVVDYLLKPVAYERFVKACNKALELNNLRKLAQQPGNSAAAEPGYIFVHVDYSMVKINLDEIVMMEALKDYIKIHFSGGRKPLLVRMSMKNMEETLPGNRFVRIHKSYIVSIAHISAVRKNSVFIDKLELPVSEQYKDTLTRITKGPL
jgi:DNA-binding LytR/AlgR family response regulator